MFNERPPICLILPCIFINDQASPDLMQSACRRPLRWLHAPRRRCSPSERQWRLGSQIRRREASSTPAPRTRSLLTLAIESSCDDTCVALLSKHPDGSATLHYNAKRTSDNRAFGGVHPSIALAGHHGNLGDMIAECLPFLPDAGSDGSGTTVPLGDRGGNTREGEGEGEGDHLRVRGQAKRKPDFVSVTRGPGMVSNLSAGLNTAKGIAAAWQVPLLGVNHMQAHALTPRLVTALEMGKHEFQQRDSPSSATQAAAEDTNKPDFPFLSLLVSGGHTLLVHSRSLNDHRILAQAPTLAIGDAIDKAARFILPQDILSATGDVMYGRVLESFAFPTPETGYGYHPPPRRVDEVATYTSEHGWHLTPPRSKTRDMVYDFTGFGSQIQRIMDARPDMGVEERRLLARQTMRLIFEHLATRIIFALDDPALGLGGKPMKRKPGAAGAAEGNNLSANGQIRAETGVRTLVVSGGVASNRYLMHILRAFLDQRGHGGVEITAPPPALCTDNAAMIAWTGMEMYQAGYETGFSAQAIRKWPLDPTGEDGGILGVDGWIKRA